MRMEETERERKRELVHDARRATHDTRRRAHDERLKMHYL